MYLPPLQPANNSHVYVWGDVTIHPSAAIAPGAILQAAPDSKIVIAAGVCLGMGAIINAYQGTIEIEPGATLGTGVLIVGYGKIGANACVGAATTIFNASVAAREVIAAGSVLGDTSRQVDLNAETEKVTEEESPPETLASNTEAEIPTETSSEKPPEAVQNGSQPPSPQQQDPSIYGQDRVQQILQTLFPHRQSLNNPRQDIK
ncbi:LbetaH domain-containing protein [Oscillatoria salina]|uniref:carbon dioxide concentrating mechanism protein n=1 Tax=Oscillatoria salina TaxID=331517 RepID=UPI0013B91C87|nr:carbon dioxide concentrating mechanism protein [Oscillatoria salina]MBZ8180708.1 transferase [Oscillatoria salina IIICB1]NET87574.1 transferase [Kamptonema sp. SIO1D9]